eukprot:11329719-Alexandrium_andersonii.AAC.1
MSASLVGSEMCIRDSPSTAKPRAWARTKAGGQRRGDRARTMPEKPNRCCLLYTSDAADDM